MSITFAPTAETIVVTDYRLGCYCLDNAGTLLGTSDYETAALNLLPYRVGAPLTALGCTADAGACEPRLDAVHAHAEAPSVNLANTNAAHVLDLLGYTQPVTAAAVGHATTPTTDGMAATLLSMTSVCSEGEDSADAFLARVVMAQALDTFHVERPASTTGGNGAMQVVDCGQRPGYLSDVLDRLTEVAEYARRHALIVTWY